jgi:glycosyltransferase involved in cell wall biosynthesis
MRVGFDARWYNDSGVGTYVAGLLRAMALAKRDFELLVYEDPQNRVPGLDGLPVVRVPAHASKYSVAEQWELGRRARQDKLDLFHSPFYIVPLSAGCPVVVTVHDLIPFLFRLYPWPKQAMVKAGYRVALRRAQHVITDSENTATDVREIMGVPRERITTVPIAASQDFTDQAVPEELKLLQEKHGVRSPYVVGASARNWRTKNLESALAALELARAQTGIEFQTVVYGPPDGLDALEARERRQKLNLRRLGYVDAADLAVLFRHAHAFLMPSLYEGFGLPILEAMSCGCAVVTSNAGSLKEVAGAGARVFEPMDVAGMAMAIGELLRNPEELHRSRVSALRRAADFSWDNSARQTISVYHRIQQQSSSKAFVDTDSKT